MVVVRVLAEVELLQKDTKEHNQEQDIAEKAGFEGGQMPIQRRLPKRGFKNRNRVAYTALNLSKIEELVAKYNFKEITPEVLQEANL